MPLPAEKSPPARAKIALPWRGAGINIKRWTTLCASPLFSRKTIGVRNARAALSARFEPDHVETLPSALQSAAGWLLLLQINLAAWLRLPYTEGTISLLILRENLTVHAFDQVFVIYQQT